MTHSSIDSIMDATTIEALQASSKATCVILDPTAHPFRPVALTPPKDLTSTQFSELQGMLLDPQSWYFAKKQCMPFPTALFRLQSDDCYVTVEIQMQCVGWIITGPRGRWGGFFDPVQEPLRAMLNALFPEYASSSRRSMWKSGVIAKLRATANSGDATDSK